jgi:hypothetical protein
MLIHVIKIYNFDCNSFSLIIIKLIINNTEYNNILGGSKVNIS